MLTRMCAVCGIIHDGRAKACITELQDRLDRYREFVELTGAVFDSGMLGLYPGEPDEEQVAEDWRNRLTRLRG